MDGIEYEGRGEIWRALVIVKYRLTSSVGSDFDVCTDKLNYRSSDWNLFVEGESGEFLSRILINFVCH